MTDKAQSLGLTLISPLALPTSDPRHPDYVKPDDDDQDGSGAGSDGDWLRIEQPPWTEKPDGGFSEWLQESGKGMSIATLQEYWAQYKSWCGDDGALEVPIRVHRSRDDLNYSLKATYGTLSPVSSEVTERVESRTVEGASKLDLEASVQGKVTAEWEGPVFGKDGSRLTKNPTVTADGNTLDLGTEVGKGTMRLSYSEGHDAYTLTITPRKTENTDRQNRESAYESTVYASWGDGQVTSHDVELPDMTGSCAEGGLSGVTDSEGGDDEKCVRHVVLVDPCTKKVIREWDEQIACPEEKK